MNLFGLSPGELLLILLVAMIVLGPEKLPDAAGSIGRWIREFRRVTAELTEQFQDENPFAEIQRALSLTDEPAESETPPAEVVGSVAGSEPNVVEVAGSGSTVGSVSVATPSAATTRSDYFAYPSYYAAIDDAWTHSGLNGYHARQSQPPTLIEAIGDDWLHGVPIIVAPPPIAEVAMTGESSDNGSEPLIETVEASAVEVREEVVASKQVEQTSESTQPLEMNGDHPHDEIAVEPGHSALPIAVGAGAGHGEERAT